MAKVLLIGDTHNGSNGNNTRLLQQNVELYETLRKIIKAYNVDFCVDLGDFFDDREKIDVKTLGIVRNQMLKDLPVPFYFIVGNHNLYYKNSTLVNNLTETIGDLPNVHVVDKFMQVGGIDLIPWITNSNVEQIREQIHASTNYYCAGHFEFNGFPFDKSRVSEVKEKISVSDFHHYIQVISGHYHIASHKGNILYLGTPIQLTWIDVDVEKQVLVLDTDNGEHRYLVSSQPLYRQFTINEDGTHNLEGITKDDIATKRIKVHYHINCDKETINNWQSILKSFGPDQLSFIPFGQKKKTETQVSISSGLEQSMKEYVDILPMDNPKLKPIVEKLLFKYYNQLTNKE